jgi:hypothetical protein
VTANSVVVALATKAAPALARRDGPPQPTLAAIVFCQFTVVGL